MNRKITLFALGANCGGLGGKRVGERACRVTRGFPVRRPAEEAVARKQAGQRHPGEAGPGFPEELPAGPAAEGPRAIGSTGRSALHGKGPVSPER